MAESIDARIQSSPKALLMSNPFNSDSLLGWFSLVGDDDTLGSGVAVAARSFSKIKVEPYSNLKKVENNASEAGDEIYDKVYTVDSGYNCFNEFKGAVYEDFLVTTPRDFGNNIHGDFEDHYIKRLYNAGIS
ncbi:hypothetical protein S245_063684 [Arachis hypogaea]